MTKYLLISCLIIQFALILNTNVDGAKVLGVFTTPGHSHYYLGHRLLKAMAEKGHEVTMVSCFKLKSPIKNYKEVVVEGFVESMNKMKKDYFEVVEGGIMNQIIFFSTKARQLFSETPLQSPNVQKLIKSNEKFDLVVMDVFINEVNVAFAHVFDAPLVLLSTVGSNLWVNHYTGNPNPVSYCPNLYLNYFGKMNFWERLHNFFIHSFMYSVFHIYHMPAQNELMHKYFPDVPNIDEIIKNRTSLVLMNSHGSYTVNKPLVPNMVEIGGYHVDDPKPLTKDLKEYLDNAKEGFILFSLGSNIKSAALPEAKLKIILNVFKKLPYKILWKFEEENLPGKPDNVRIEKWLSQNDILSHPNIKLFITHGGMLSTIEALYHGVPIVGIPVAGDQRNNVAISVNFGVGLSVPYTELTYDKLLSSITEVINNDKYRKNSKKRSELMRDRPMKPIDAAVYWMEYAIRHKSAEHLKTGAVDLKWYEENLLDIYAFLGGITFIIFYIFYCTCRKLCCKRKPVYKFPQEKKKKE